MNRSPVPDTPALDARAIARNEFGSLTRLAIPIIVTQLSQMGMGIADTIMAGHLGAAELAGVALGGNLFWPIMMLLSGTVMAVTPSVAQLNGARRDSEVGEVVRQTLWLGAIGGLLGIVLLGFSEDLFRWVEVDPRAIPIAVGYLDAMAFGLLPVVGYFVLRYLCEGLSWTMPAMVIALSALALKIPFNIWFIYGGFGLPAMGAVGCGVASAIIMGGEFVAMIGVVLFSRMQRVGLFAHFSKPNLKEMARLVRLGAPIGATMFFEMAVFSAVALLVGRLGVEALAAHQIALIINGVTFMIPMALGIAATIRVGFNVGAQDYGRARIAGLVAIGSSVLFAAAAGAVLLLGREAIAGLFSTDASLVAVAAELLIFVAFYQFFDDGQAAAMGVLRGYKDTRMPLVTALVAYWVIALPLGAWLAFDPNGMGVYGFWWGFTAGLGVAAIVLTARVLWMGRSEQRIAAFAAR
ncbi:MAG: MATE family efflux transporter [Gammaproteobacteria bacterium]|nr:MATE family efflux transporter [Gammaproteobacteria bacterium]